MRTQLKANPATAPKLRGRQRHRAQQRAQAETPARFAEQQAVDGDGEERADRSNISDEHNQQQVRPQAEVHRCILYAAARSLLARIACRRRKASYGRRNPIRPCGILDRADRLRRGDAVHSRFGAVSEEWGQGRVRSCAPVVEYDALMTPARCHPGRWAVTAVPSSDQPPGRVQPSVRSTAA